MKVWIDTQSGTWGEVTHLVLAEVPDERLDDFANLSDSERVDFVAAGEQQQQHVALYVLIAYPGDVNSDGGDPTVIGAYTTPETAKQSLREYIDSDLVFNEEVGRSVVYDNDGMGAVVGEYPFGYQYSIHKVWINEVAS